MQGWLGRGLPGALSKIADKRKRRNGRWRSLGNMGSRAKKRVLGSGPGLVVPCTIRAIIVHAKINASGPVSGYLSRPQD